MTTLRLAAAGLVLVLVLVAGGAGIWLYLDNRDLRAQVRNALVNMDLLQAALKRPVTVNVDVPGAGPQPVHVSVTPGAPGTPPRLVAEAPPVLCRTEAECRRIFGAARQTVTIEAAVRKGTLVQVCLDPLGADGICARSANLPLVEPFAFRIDAVLSERGVFHVLQPLNSPLTFTRVTTETPVHRIDAPRLPYHFAAVPAAILGGRVFSGFEYQNRTWAGLYRVQVGYGYPGIVWGLAAIIPLR